MQSRMPTIGGHAAGVELAERERELAALTSALAEATAGRGGMAVVTGEAGAGKTALLQGFCGAALLGGGARPLGDV